MKPNWFIALPVDLGALLPSLVADAPRSVRVFDPRDLHLTIAFLGPVDATVATAAFARAYTPPLAALTAELGPVEPFGNPRNPSAFALTTRGPGRDALATFMAAHTNAILAVAHRPPETRSPRPHITLARPRRSADAEARAEARRWAERIAVPAGSAVHFERIALYTWATDRRNVQFTIADARDLSP